MATRVIVTGKYVNRRTYILYNEDGTEFQVIREGEPFRIDNQLRSWYPVQVPKKRGNGTILMCQKFGDSGNVIEEFPLIHNKRGLWALTSGAARNGVFHNYHEPQTALEKKLHEMGSSSRVIEKVEKIDLELTLGGEFSPNFKTDSDWGYCSMSDGEYEDLTEPLRSPERPDYMLSTYTSHVYGATYLIYYEFGTCLGNGFRSRYIKKIYLTPEADENVIIGKLSELQSLKHL